ncbi:hypothetical protein LAZ40_04495 [Cereibacter sphaeroides]|uniref:hypothetical protein n=1 Tax=Cereibacter sphaeroides TaxID=1063 RepID=UPI001F41E857|nr:hypothetical protein [Cereibacter sphaeroides]MCE6958315.1 hypothetical protein [Cereibacter sphaeroides]MCE6971925.1 hypothetical protein [Cereibacter sphaeroides]
MSSLAYVADLGFVSTILVSAWILFGALLGEAAARPALCAILVFAACARFSRPVRSGNPLIGHGLLSLMAGALSALALPYCRSPLLQGASGLILASGLLLILLGLFPDRRVEDPSHEG